MAEAVNQSQPLSANQLAALINTACRAPFVAKLREADEPLWGSFWQFDVIAPGYTLPAAELALLRATRLDGYWSLETSLAEYLADLRAAVAHPQAGVWSATLAGAPLAIFAAPTPPQLMTVVWHNLADGCLHAGYRAAAVSAHFTSLMPQRRPAFPLLDAPASPPSWLSNLSHLPAANSLDGAILRRRKKHG